MLDLRGSCLKLSAWTSTIAFVVRRVMFSLDLPDDIPLKT